LIIGLSKGSETVTCKGHYLLLDLELPMNNGSTIRGDEGIDPTVWVLGVAIDRQSKNYLLKINTFKILYQFFA
jgi:hypothetical protein